MMNKSEIDRLLPDAYKLLQSNQIAEKKNGEWCIDSSYRSQISSFGAAVTQGSLLAAVAYYSSDAGNGSSKVSRSKLMKCIFELITKDGNTNKTNNLFDYIAKNKEKEEYIKEDIINAAISLKLAMNLCKLEQNK